MFDGADSRSFIKEDSNMYYGLIAISVILFGISFKFKDIYQKKEKVANGLKSTFRYTIISSIAALIILLFINGFKLEFTWFTFIIALLSDLDVLCFSYCSFKALEKINLSLYSLYSMLGGMLLPFFQGILFYNEPLTIAKILCAVLISGALLLMVKNGKSNGGGIYCWGVFLFNGMLAMLTKIFTASDFEKTSSGGFAILTVMCSIVISFLALKIFFKSKGEPTVKTSPGQILVAALEGGSNRVANLLLVIALVHVDASVQYPMVTGGVVVVSTLISFLDGNKPTKKEILAVSISLLGLLALLLPI